MRRRIGEALDAGERPSLQSNLLKLGSVVLQRVDGRAAPALAETEIQMRRRGINTAGAFDTFAAAAPVRRGRSTYATDTQGIERRITRPVGGENRVTPAGRRFYRQSYTRWLVHIPTYKVRRTTGARFHEGRHDMTGEDLGMSTELQARGSEAEQRAAVEAAVSAFLNELGDDALAIYVGDENVEIYYDRTRQPTYSMQTTGIRDGAMTADTILDRVVFGAPVFPEDMWQLCHLHEVSRRRSGECGLDVIVASAQQMGRQGDSQSWKRKPIMTAQQAADALIKLARKVDPEGALAQTTFQDVPQTAEVLGVDEDLRMRKPDVSTLSKYYDGMRAFLSKPRTVEEIQKAVEKQHIWRGPHKVEQRFAEAVRSVFLWTKTPRTRLLLFLRSADFHVEGEQVMLEAPIQGAVEAIKECGTPVRLLVAYYEQLRVKLVLLNGSRCVRIWEPKDWATRERRDQISVVLNVWSDHVSCYTPLGCAPNLTEQSGIKWRDLMLAMAKADDDEHRYDDMQELDWCLLLHAYQEKGKGVVFWTTDSREELESGLKAHDLTFIPHYSAPGRLNGIDVPFNDGKHKASIRIKIVPEHHLQLREFCQKVQEELKLKLYYKGESEGVLGHNYLREYLVRKREAIPLAQQKERKDKQENKCAKCKDLLRQWEVHHDPPVSEGGTSNDIVLICRTCHAEETEKQELKGTTSPQYFESQLAPDMMEAFRTLPKPLQQYYGDPITKERAMQSDGVTQLLCMDVRGCRKNALLERPYLPVGSPFDWMRPVFRADASYSKPLTEFAWLWVETEGEHPLYDGPHLYPLETVQVLMEEGFLQANSDTLPFGWVPYTWFPSSDLADAWANLERCGGDKKMILATIGLWNKQERLSWYARRTDCEADMPGPVSVKSFQQDGTIMMCATELYDNRTMLPVSLLCLFDEQRHMHKARQLVARVPRIEPLGCMVDGLFFVGPDEAELELRRLVDEQKYPLSMTDVFQFKEATWKQVPVCRQKRGSGRECFKPPIRRVWASFSEDIDEEGLRDILVANDEKFEEKWSMIREANPRLDPFQVYVAMATMYNPGALILGAAGTGKSEILRTIRKVLNPNDVKPGPMPSKKADLQSMAQTLGVNVDGQKVPELKESIRTYLESLNEGHSKVRVCAYTHAATRLVGGETVARLLHLNTQLADTTFLVDEIGLLPLSTLGAISRWMALGAKFICFGDFQGQFEPFKDRWNLPMSAEHSPLMHELCAGFRITLTTYRRGEDPELFSWYWGMYGQEDVNGLVAESRARYPAACERQCDPLVLCISHAKRMTVNTRQNQLLKPEGAVFLEWEGEDLTGATMQPQSMHVWPGLELIGCPRGSGLHAAVQGVLYVINDITETHLQLTMHEEYRHGADDEEVAIPLEEACSQLRLAHAMCYYTVQGRTIRDRHIVLLDTDHQHFTTRSLIVALSRATHGRFLHVGDSTSEGLFGRERVVKCGRSVKKLKASSY